jgi:hypothetical protein
VTAPRALRGSAIAGVLAALIPAAWGCLADPPTLLYVDAAPGDSAADGAPIGDATTATDSPTDAASEGGAFGDGATVDAGPADAPAETAVSPVTPATFCRAQAELAVRCDPDDAGCYASNESRCTAIYPTLSEATQQAFVACLPNVQCVSGYDFLGQTCVRRALDLAAPTAGQANLRDTVCASCGAGDACVASFYASGLTTGNTGPGFYLLPYSDAVVESVALACTAGLSDASDCLFMFGVCAALVVPQSLPPDACKDGGS